MTENNILLAFILTSAVGLSTILGAFIVFAFKKYSYRSLSFGLGFSAGVMLFLSFFELLGESKNKLELAGLDNPGRMVALFFLIGLIAAAVIDAITHKYIAVCALDDSSCGSELEINCNKKNEQTLLKTGIFAMIAMTLHNFPEGIATFTTASADLTLGFSIAIAIAIHNIPEGLCVALPIFHATKNWKKCLLYTTVAGLAEPAGALLAFLILYPFMNQYVISLAMSSVAGIMVYISIDALLPAAKKAGQWHTALSGMVVGMLFMFVILQYFV